MTSFAHLDLDRLYATDQYAIAETERRVRAALPSGEISWVAAKYVHDGSQVQTWAPGREIPRWATHVRCVAVAR